MSHPGLVERGKRLQGTGAWVNFRMKIRENMQDKPGRPQTEKDKAMYCWQAEDTDRTRATETSSARIEEKKGESLARGGKRVDKKRAKYLPE